MGMFEDKELAIIIIGIFGICCLIPLGFGVASATVTELFKYGCVAVAALAGNSVKK